MSLYLDGDYGQEPNEDDEGEHFIGTEELSRNWVFPVENRYTPKEDVE